jgi:hypothetical protein
LREIETRGFTWEGFKDTRGLGGVLHGRGFLGGRYFKTHGVFLKVFFGGKLDYVDTYVTTYYKPLPPKKYFPRTPYQLNKLLF